MTRTGFLLLLLFANTLTIAMSLEHAAGTHLSSPVVGVWSDTYKSPHISDFDLTPSAPFQITINVTEVTDLLNYDITLQYFSPILTAQAATLLPVGGQSFIPIASSVDDGTGIVRMSAGLHGGSVTVATSAALFSVDFVVDSLGSTSLSLLQAKLGVLVGGQPIVIDVTPTAIHGSFTNTGAELPVASFTFGWADTFPDGVITQGETVTFDASASFDPDASPGATNNGIASYQWSFGDETPTVVELDPLIDHVFQDREGKPKYGIFTVTLTVFDEPNNPGSNSKQSQQLTVVRLPTHDLRVTSLEAVPSQATRGQQVVFHVSVRNIGTFLENFTVTLLAESLLIGTQSFENVGPDESRTPEFTWDTGTVDSAQYIITANVTVAPGETNAQDNSLQIVFTVNSPGSGSSTLLLAVGSVVAGTGLISGLAYVLRRKRANRAKS